MLNGRSASRVSDLLYGMLVCQLLTTGLAATLPKDMKPLKKQTLAQGVKTIVPSNYALSFDITPTGLHTGWSSIIQYTQDDTDTGSRGRIPALFLYPNSTRLVLHVSTSSLPYQSIHVADLPPNEQTNVRVEAVGNEIAVFFNNSIVQFAALQGLRYSGEATVFKSSPWMVAAKASISPIQLASISSITGYGGQPLVNFNGRISKGALIEKTFVPADYALTFDIIPTAIASANNESSIIHYTQDNSNIGPKGRMPAVYFYRNMTKLRIFVATTLYPSQGISYSSALPLNSRTRVRIEAVGQYMMLFLNNTFDRMVAVNGTRYFGNANVLLSDPWAPSAKALISSIRMSSLISSHITKSDSGTIGDIPKSLLIYNSLFDDCSKAAGADAGCGHNLQCNTFSDGKSSCEPVANSLISFLHSIDESDTNSIIVSKWHQTCGLSSRYRNTCSQTAGPLTCSKVYAIVKGQESTKWICLRNNELDSRLQKRIVIRRFWYSDDDAGQSYGQNYRAI